MPDMPGSSVININQVSNEKLNQEDKLKRYKIENGKILVKFNCSKIRGWFPLKDQYIKK